MQSQPPNTQGPSPQQPTPGAGVQAAVPSIPGAPPSLPAPQALQAPMHPMLTSGASTPGSGTPTIPFPQPQRGWTSPTMPSMPTPPTLHPLRPVLSEGALSSRGSSRVNLAAITTEKLQIPTALEELHEGLNFQEGEMPVLEKDDRSWTTMIRVQPLVTQKPKDLPWWNCCSDEFSWVDGFGVLLANYFLLLGKETTPTGEVKSTHIIRPIPLECLRLASFNDEEEGRKHKQGFMKQVFCCCSSAPLQDPMYPFTIYHSAAKITRRHTLYTSSATERNRWHTALESAIAERQSQRDGKMLYTTKILNDRFFRIAPRIQFTRGVHYTGRTVCAAGFTSQAEGYIAVGCTTGIYVSKRATEYSFRKVLEFNEPTSIAAIPMFDKFLVHCEKALYSYPLDMIVRASRGGATFNDLDNVMERLAKDHGNVSFLKTDSINGRTLVIYAATLLEQTSAHILELTREDVKPGDPAKYKLLSSIPIPNETHDAVIFRDKAVICASKAVYIVEPLKTTDPSHTEVPKLPYPKPGKKFWPFAGENKGDKPKILDLIDKANVLGAVPYLNDILLVYEDFGCFVDRDGKPARTSYYIQWERRASAYTRRGGHLLLLSPGYIEVRKIDSCKLVQIVETSELRLLRSSLTDPVPIAAMIGGTEDDGGRTEKIVELISNEY